MHYFSGKGCSEFLESMHYCIGILTSCILNIYLFIYSVLADAKSDTIFRNLANYFNFTVSIRVIAGTWSLYHRKKGTKKQSALTENTSIKTNCSLFTLIIFSEHTYFLRKP